MTQSIHPIPLTDRSPGSPTPVEPDRRSSPMVVTAPLITAHILLVDDDPRSLMAMEAVLAGPGRTIVKAESGQDALRHLLQQDFAVILLDVRMPRLDGFETAQLIRGRARSRYTPIIFLSGVDTMDSDAYRGLSCGAVDYLFKPVVPEVLSMKVTVFVDLFRLGEQVKQQAVKQSEERFRLLVEQIHDYAIILLDSNGVVETWNAAAQRMKGYAAAEIVGQSMTRFYTLDDRAAGKPEALLKTARTAGRAEDEGCLVRMDGSRFLANVVLTALHDEAGQLRGFAKVTRDITEQRAAEEAVARLAAVVESSDDAIVGRTLDGIVVSWNKGAERIYEYSAEEVIGRPISFLIPPDHVDEEPGILARIKLGERVEHYETVRIRKDGKRIDVSMTVSPIRDASGKIIGASKVARDITERKRWEQEREELVKQLRTSQEELMSKVDDLERFHDIAVGRELKMLELEKEVLRLKSAQSVNQGISPPSSSGRGDLG